MGYPGIWQILIVLLLVVLLFGRGKISDLMGDVAKGITSFKKGLKDEGEDAASNVHSLEQGKDVDQSSSLNKEKADLS